MPGRRWTDPRALLLLALLLGLTLRVAGLGWGLPNPDRHYPYHPDEPLVAMAALRVDFSSPQTLSPGQFNYGSLSLYLDRLAAAAASALGWIDLAPPLSGGAWRLVGETIRVGRWLTVLMGLLTIAATAMLGTRLYGPGVGALAALLLAVTPLHVAHGHYSTVDVPATWWATLCLLLSAAALRAPGRGVLAAAGACAGLAASTKYNAGLVLLAPTYALLATWRRPEWTAPDRAAALVYAPMAAAASFLLTTPGIFLDSAAFWRDFFYEVRHTGAGHGLVFADTPPAWLYHLTRSLPDGLGYPLLLAVMLGVITALVRHRPEDGLLLVFSLPYYLLIGSAEVKFSRYLLPILPALLLLAARALVGQERTIPGGGEIALQENPSPLSQNWERGLGGEGRHASPAIPHADLVWLPRLRTVLTLIVLLWTTAYAAAMAGVFTRADPRDQAAAWIMSQRQTTGSVALAGEPWFYTPPLTPALGCTHALTPVCGAPLPVGVLAPGLGRVALSPAQLAESSPTAVVVSEFEYADALRLHATNGHSDPTVVLMQYLLRHYRLERTFRNRPSLGPLRWFVHRPPVHDLLYPMPDVRVYVPITGGR